LIRTTGERDGIATWRKAGVKGTGIESTVNGTTTTIGLAEGMVRHAGIEARLPAVIHPDAQSTMMTTTVGEMIALIMTETANESVIEIAVEIATMFEIIAKIGTVSETAIGIIEMIGTAALDTHLVRPETIEIETATLVEADGPIKRQLAHLTWLARLPLYFMNGVMFLQICILLKRHGSLLGCSKIQDTPNKTKSIRRSKTSLRELASRIDGLNKYSFAANPD
jgi:hypothetical protein